MRQPISVEKRVAVTIWKLATNVEYRTLSELFGLGKATVGRIVVETCQAISKVFTSNIPQGNRLKEVVDGFELC